MYNELQFRVYWDMPNHKTFEIKAILEFIILHCGINWKKDCIDPFPFPFKEDALQFLRRLPIASVLKLLFDPPYSQRQLFEMYKKAGLAYNHPKNNAYWSLCKKEIARVMKPGGTVLTFGWTGAGIGKTYGFKEIDGIIVRHGSMHNSTIGVAEIKIK